MTEPKDRIEHTLEVLVYAPIGVGLYLKDMGPTFVNMFVARGRAEIDRRQAQVQQRTTTAKSIGQVAVAFGVPMVQAAGRARGRHRARTGAVVPRIDRRIDASNGAPVAPGRGPAPAPTAPDAEALRATAAPAAESAPADTNGSQADPMLPIPGYDSSVGVAGRRAAGRPVRRRARGGARVRGVQPQPAHHSRQDRPDLRVGTSWKTRASRTTPSSSRVAELARELRRRAASNNAAARSGRRARPRPEPLDAALLRAQPARRRVGARRHHSKTWWSATASPARDTARRLPARRHRGDLRGTRGAGGRGGGAAGGTAGCLLHRCRLHRRRRDRAPR